MIDDTPVLVRSPWYQNVAEEAPLSYDIRAGDRDDRTFVLEATHLPRGASFRDHGDNSGTFSWTPEYGQAGDHKAGFTATNSAGETDRAFTSIRVNLLNDDFDRARPVSTLPFVDERDLGLATTAPDDPTCMDQSWMPPVGWTVWYSFTPSMDLPIFVSTAEAASISVFTGARGALQEIVCGTSSPFFLEAAAHRTYFIMIGAYGAPDRVETKVGVAPRLDLRLQLDSTDALPPERDSAFVTGTVKCSRASTVYAWLTLEQSRGHRDAQGTNCLRLDCTGETAWSARVGVEGQSLLPGRASVRIYAIAIDTETGRYALAEEQRFLLLRP